MARFLDASAGQFERDFVELLGAKREAAADVDDAVANIIADVRARGDEALREYSLRFDRVDFTRVGLQVSAAEIDAAAGRLFARTTRRTSIGARADRRVSSSTGAEG